MWSPKDEAEACCELVAFLEWMRATKGNNGLTPERLVAWHATEPTAFCAAVADYARVGGIAAAERAAAMLNGWEALRRPV